MKKLTFLALALAFCISVNAQNTVTNMTGNGATVTNSGSASCSLAVNYTHEQLSIQITATKVSGTIAGTAILYGSVDGTNYNAIGSDTLTLTNVTTNTKVWVLTNANYAYYKVTVTGSGTMAATIVGKLYASGAIFKHASSNLKSNYDLSTDTVTNSGSGYVGITVNNYYPSMTIQAIVTKISGTVAGTVTLQGSNDASNYVTVSSNYASATTHTATDVATSTKHFVITGSPYKYYRLSYTGSGTMAATIAGKLLPNKK